MIKILKQGIKPKKTKTIYTAICELCGCIFEFEDEDIKGERIPNGNLFINCPNCYYGFKRTYAELNPRTVEVENND